MEELRSKYGKYQRERDGGDAVHVSVLDAARAPALAPSFVLPSRARAQSTNVRVRVVDPEPRPPSPPDPHITPLPDVPPAPRRRPTMASARPRSAWTPNSARVPTPHPRRSPRPHRDPPRFAFATSAAACEPSRRSTTTASWNAPATSATARVFSTAGDPSRVPTRVFTRAAPPTRLRLRRRSRRSRLAPPRKCGRATLSRDARRLQRQIDARLAEAAKLQTRLDAGEEMEAEEEQALAELIHQLQRHVRSLREKAEEKQSELENLTASLRGDVELDADELP